MIIIVHPGSGGGTALAKLRRIEPAIRNTCADVTIESTHSAKQVREVLLTAYARGERHIIAAGGDGCVNLVASILLSSFTDAQRDTLTLGAIGLGSSNDFHKPFDEHRCPEGIPCMIDPSSARPRDVVAVDDLGNGQAVRHYFLINGSAGLTAEANRRFNSPGLILGALKRIVSPFAIVATALTTLLTYRNRSISISNGTGDGRTIRVTNLALLKNPHVSGSLRFPGEPDYTSGTITCHLAEDLGVAGRLSLFRTLLSGEEPSGDAHHRWGSDGLVLASESPFPFEFDGEVISSTKVRVSVLPSCLKVCTC